jgi:hypothetical protein
MAASVNHFALLAAQARAGSIAAKDRLRHDLEPCLVRIVQYALAQAAPVSRLHQRVRALAQQIGGRRSSPEAIQRLLVRFLYQWVLGRLTSGDTAILGQMRTLIA